MSNAQLVAVADADEIRLGKVQKKFDIKSHLQGLQGAGRGPRRPGRGRVAADRHARRRRAGRDQGRQARPVRNAAGLEPQGRRRDDRSGRQGPRHADAQPHLPLHPELREGQGTDRQGQARQYLDADVPRVHSGQGPGHAVAGGMLGLGYREVGGPLYTLAVWSLDLLRWLAGSDIVEVIPDHQVHEARQVRRHVGLRRRRHAPVRQRHGRLRAVQRLGDPFRVRLATWRSLATRPTWSTRRTTTRSRCSARIRSRANGM